MGYRFCKKLAIERRRSKNSSRVAKFPKGVQNEKICYISVSIVTIFAPLVPNSHFLENLWPIITFSKAIVPIGSKHLPKYGHCRVIIAEI